MGRQKVTYPLADVVDLIVQNRYRVTGTVAKLLLNHGYDIAETVSAIAASMDLGAALFHKADELRVKPGIFADIYYVNCLDEQWYVKFYVVDEVIFMSCKVDSAGW